ncbi:hypothetical protein CK627_20885 [Aeromonas dhakensis]|uniref:hypothetical protein n=1 Tax=Aeromonas dhakensis TaxID=196024 RepID=UPI000BAB1D02|nr:hypothetical protein [Aeromonas dhakensis]ASX13065.1 hypothetical protein CK627_20885 [Aeromonas dhakensis]
MNIWSSIKKFFTKVVRDEAFQRTINGPLKEATNKVVEAAEQAAVDYVKDKAIEEVQRLKR